MLAIRWWRSIRLLSRQSEGAVKLDQGNLDQAKVNLAYCHITSLSMAASVCAWLAVTQAEGQLARDQAQLELAKVNLTRDTDLLNKGVISKQEFDTQNATNGQIRETLSRPTARRRW